MYLLVNNKSFADAVPPIQIPTHETLKDVILRTIPYWNEQIAPEVANGKRVLIVAHGTSLRGIVKYIEDLDQDAVKKLNLPTGIPFVYELNMDTMIPVVPRRYLADDNTVEEAIDKVLNMGLKK